MPEAVNEQELVAKFGDMLSLDNVEKAMVYFSKILDELGCERQCTINETLHGGEEFWKRYLAGLKSTTGINIQMKPEVEFT